MNNQPLVSVYVPTYYHEKYLKQALDSILMQKRDFPIEIIISDDASKDNTQNIAKEYASKYDFIKLHFFKQNVGLTTNIYTAESLCIGKYITPLAGDDYWIDEYNLQKKVDFLENNLQFFCVTSRYEIRYDDETNATSIGPNSNIINKPFTLDMYLKGDNYSPRGMMMRNPFISHEKELFELMPKFSKYVDDLANSLFILMSGNVYTLSDITEVYRVHKNADNEHNFNSLNDSISIKVKYLECLNNINNCFHDKLDLFYRYRYILLQTLYFSIKLFNLKSFLKVYKLIPKNIRNRGILMHCFVLLPTLAIKSIINKTNKILKITR